MSFLGEVKRRKVFQVAAIYIVVAWLIIQVVDVINEPLNLPDWFDTVAILLLSIGFPIAVITSWAFDLTPQGVVRDQGRPVARTGTRRSEYVLVALLAVAVLWIGYRELNPPGPASEDVLPNSVAVLPFENMSADPDDAYFAAGIHDEILNRLAKLSNLNVIARTSVLQYAGAARPITEIARELNVATIMEGSVSYADNRVAVRAQLIDAETGVHLWSDSYNREFSDVFGIQADIAMNVANALEAEFSLAEQEAIEKRPTESPEAYALYLSGISRTDPTGALSDLDQATSIDPEFALAYAAKAVGQASVLIGFGAASPDQVEELERQARDNAQRALELDPTLGSAYAAVGAVHIANWRAAEAEEALERAYQLSPNDPDVLQFYARFKRYRGEYSEAVALMQRAVRIDPNNPTRQQNLGVAYRYARDYGVAAAVFRRGLELEPSSQSLRVNLARAEVARGNQTEALRQLNLTEVLSGEQRPNSFRLTQMAFTYSQAGRRDEAERLFKEIEDGAQQEPVGDATWARAYLAIGDTERALEHLRSASRDRVPTDVGTLAELAANVSADPVLESDPRFREILSDLWQ